MIVLLQQSQGNSSAAIENENHYNEPHDRPLVIPKVIIFNLISNTSKY